VTTTVPGTAWAAMLLAVVATKVTSRVAAGVPPEAEALMVAMPAEVDEIVTPGVLPAPSVIEGLPAMLPRLVQTLLVARNGRSGAGPVDRYGVGVFRGISTDGAAW